MRLFIVDECNVSHDDKLGFFIYGGIVVPENEIRPLSQSVFAIKREFGINKARAIKWNNTSTATEDPLDQELHKQIKDRILGLFTSSNARIIVCLSPQEFYHDVTFIGLTFKKRINHTAHIRTQEYALNDVLKKFNYFLREEDELGMIFADKYSDSFRHHMTEHCFKLFPSGDGRFSLERIIYPVIQLNDEYSQLHQMNDVVLGAIQYSLKELGYNSLPRISKNFWKSDLTSNATILGRGFDIFPKVTKSEIIRQNQEKLTQKFLRLIM